ncbi:MAG: transporter substrate-binding domain-containing protein [Aquipseudomonas alcaligenes]|uniref:Transporter substrate-binding domain-containing protein n=1 Tax=Aquipseudomonas alcaligenes TaxID=43263 RepID=A0A5C7W7Z9_AQUAC|nr:MAG: transporter substrate-binding domain-containing protein [Pseudomonas alcaligenes]
MFLMQMVFCLLVALLYVGGVAADEPLALHMPDAPPLTLYHDERGHGIVGDITLAAITLSGRTARIVDEPWARAQVNVASGQNQLIIPLSRTPEREQRYTWIVPIMPLERAFFSLDEPVNSFAQARQRYRRIGVGLGTAQVEILRREGFADEQIIQLKLGENPAILLERGRLDAWFTGIPEALYIWHKSSEQRRKLYQIPVLASTDLYLACSRICDPQIVEQLRAAVLQLEASGVSPRLRQAYLPELDRR